MRGLGLFSGGLDSILAALVLREQGPGEGNQPVGQHEAQQRVRGGVDALRLP